MQLRMNLLPFVFFKQFSAIQLRLFLSQFFFQEPECWPSYFATGKNHCRGLMYLKNSACYLHKNSDWGEKEQSYLRNFISGTGAFFLFLLGLAPNSHIMASNSEEFSCSRRKAAFCRSSSLIFCCKRSCIVDIVLGGAGDKDERDEVRQR